MRGRFVAALVLTLVVASSCSSGSDDRSRYSLDLDGRAKIVTADGTRDVEAGRHDLDRGDTVRMVDGTAVLELPGEREVWLRERSAVTVSQRPDVVDGDAVIVSDADDTEFTVGDVEVALDEGAARVQRGLGVTIAMYGGDADIRAAGRVFAGGLRALRQLTVPATGLLPREPVPLVYDAARPDPWDRRFLGGAIDLGRQLDVRSRGFTTQLGPKARLDAALLRRVLPVLDDQDDFSDGLVDDADRSPGESLVGATIVLEAAASNASFGTRWQEVFGFRAEGAQWGLVALDQAVRRDAVLGRLASAINSSPLLFAAGGPPTTIGGTTTTSTAPPGANGGGGGGGGGGGEPDPPDDPSPIDPLPPLPPTTLPPLPGEPDPPDGTEGPDGPEGTDGPDGAGQDDPQTVSDLIDDLIDDLLF